MTLRLPAAALLLSAVLTLPAAEPIRVLVLAGQSNAVGNGTRPTDLDAHPDLKSQPAIPFRYWLRNATPTSTAFTSAPGTSLDVQIVTSTNTPFPHAVRGVYGGFGAEISLAQRLASRTGHKLALIKVAAGGTAMGDATDAAGQDWWKVGGNLHTRLVTEITDGLAALESAGFSPQLYGFFWMQGESDARKDATVDRTAFANAYQDNLTALLADLRQRFATPALPLVIGRVDPENIPAWGQYYATNADIVRAAQEAVAAADPRAAWVNTDDLPRWKDIDPASPDIIHFNFNGQITLGERMADAFLPLAEGYLLWSENVSWARPEDAAPGEDPDDDGFSNLAEYAMNLQPLTAEAPATVVQTGRETDAQGRPVLTLTLPRNPAALDVRWESLSAGHLPASLDGWDLDAPDVERAETETTITFKRPVNQDTGQSFLGIRFRR